MLLPAIQPRHVCYSCTDNTGKLLQVSIARSVALYMDPPRYVDTLSKQPIMFLNEVVRSKADDVQGVFETKDGSKHVFIFNDLVA